MFVAHSQVIEVRAELQQQFPDEEENPIIPTIEQVESGEVPEPITVPVVPTIVEDPVPPTEGPRVGAGPEEMRTEATQELQPPQNRQMLPDPPVDTNPVVELTPLTPQPPPQPQQEPGANEAPLNSGTGYLKGSDFAAQPAPVPEPEVVPVPVTPPPPPAPEPQPQPKPRQSRQQEVVVFETQQPEQPQPLPVIPEPQPAFDMSSLQQTIQETETNLKMMTMKAELMKQEAPTPAMNIYMNILYLPT